MDSVITHLKTRERVVVGLSISDNLIHIAKLRIKKKTRREFSKRFRNVGGNNQCRIFDMYGPS